MRPFPVCCALALLTLISTALTAAERNFKLVRGVGMPVCEAYLKQLNSMPFKRGPYCDRTFVAADTVLTSPVRVPLSSAEVMRLYTPVTGFLRNRDVEAYENRLNRDGSRYFSAEAREYADINERLGNLPPDSDRRGTLPQFFRLSPPMDLDNDGQVDNLVGWRPVGGSCGGQGQYEPTPHRGPTYLLFLDSKGDLDTTRTQAVFGHPGGNDLIWRDPRTGKVEVVRNPAFRSIGSGLDVIRFQGETFFDTFYDSRTRLSGELIEEQEARVLGDTLAVMQSKNGKTSTVCEMRWKGGWGERTPNWPNVN